MDEILPFQGRHIISTKDLSRDDYISILRKAKRFKYRQETRIKKNFHGQSMALLFYEPSTRTHSTFKEAIRRYGGRADHGFTSAGSTSVAKGESVEDTVIHYLGLGVNVIVIRHPMDGSAQWAADVADDFREDWGEGKPYSVINGGDGQNEHPTQAAGDVFTIQDELGDWENIGTLRIGNGLDFLSFGDIRYGRAAKSVIKAAHQVFGIKNLYMACHPFVGPTENMMAEYRKLGIPDIVVVHKPEDFIELLNGNVDVAYGSRIQEERQGKGTPHGDAKLKDIHGAIQLRKGMVTSPREHLVVMHPQPFNKINPVITRDVKREPFAKWVPQSMNHVPTRAGIVELVLFGEDI
jgi:aspartate carbamoyltransferase